MYGLLNVKLVFGTAAEKETNPIYLLHGAQSFLRS